MNVLITGAAGGLGRVLATECANRGFDLLLTDIDGEGLAAIRAGILHQHSLRVLTETCDLTSQDEVEALMAAAEAQAFAPDMLINVAGIDYEGGFCERGERDVLKIIDLNIAATLRITHAVLAANGGAKPLRVIFVCSMAAMFPIPLKATYAASKRFLYDFAIALGEELRPMGGTVLALCPGGLPTTEGAIQGILAQGLGGWLTTNRLERTARRTITKALQGKRVYIPGAVNRLISAVGRLIPKSLLARYLYGRWNHAQQKWLVRP